jgi:hypothetical protein
MIFILLLHIDDIRATVDKKEAARIEAALKQWFGEVQFEVGDELSYLGMKISIRNEGTTVDMGYYVGQILEGEEVEVEASPTTKETYTVDVRSAKLG